MRSIKEIIAPLSKEDRAVLLSIGIGAFALGSQLEAISLHLNEHPIDWYSIFGYGIFACLCLIWIGHPTPVARVIVAIAKWINKGNKPESGGVK